MIPVCLMELDKQTRLFKYLREVNVATTPNKDDKVVIDIDSIGYVFKIYEVMFADDGRTDINVIRMCTITEYNSSKFEDII